MKAVFIFVLVLLSNIVKSQSIEISFFLTDSCININSQTNAIQITIKNNTNKDIWVDLEAIKFTIYLDDKIVNPIEVTTIGIYSPKEKISQDGFVLVKKASNVLVINHSNLLKNYQLDKNREYCLKGYYNNARNKSFKMVYKNNRDIGKNFLKICE